MFKHFDFQGKKRALTLTLIFGILLLHNETNAQNRGIFVPYSSVGFGVGTSSYYGDMATYRRPLASTFKMIRWSVGGNYTRHFTPRLGARASFMWARIAGDDYVMNSKEKYTSSILFARNLHFKNDLKEFSIQGIFKLTPDNRSYDRRPQFGSYLFAGVALTAHNPKALDSLGGNWVRLQPLGTEGQGNAGYAKPYSLVQIAIPLGIGVRYKINSRFDISAELAYRVTFTDYLDDISGKFADPALFADNPTALALSNRSAERYTARKGKDRTEGLKNFLQVNYGIAEADPFTAIQNTTYGTPGQVRGNRFKDGYLTSQISIHYILPSQIKCPPLK